MTSRLKKGLTLLRAPANSVAFAVRRRLRWTRGRPILVDEQKVGLFDYLDRDGARRCGVRDGELLAAYDLAGLRTRSTRIDYRDNLYLLDALEILFAGQGALPSGSLRAIDVGAKNWNYVFALERFWRHWRSPDGRDVSMVGLEIDGHGVYRDLHSRSDHAVAYAAQTGNPAVDYRVQDFMEFGEGGADVITMLYPFLTRYSVLQWGLPLSCFRPRELVARALELLRPGGCLVVCNQTSTERRILHRMLADLGVSVVACQPLRSSLVHYHERTRDRWATLARPSEDHLVG